jgi:hypothetical protein
MPKQATNQAVTVADAIDELGNSNEVEWSEGVNEPEHELPRRRELLLEALRLVREAMNREETPSRTTVGNLVQLIKLHKEIVEEEEVPTEIQLIWNEVDEELYEKD